ncbi:MAG: zinc dependent phospholipase C family protein [Flavobacteriales bacterium]|nr:zinc dependent phospholipase C family protein [Flavobacteriales bacterium]
MPKYGIHHIILEKVRERLADGNNDQRDLHRILAQNRVEGNLGCIGPDLLFWAPDYAIVENLKDLVEAYDRVMQLLEPIKEFAEGIEENIEEGVEQVVDAMEGIPIIGPAVAVASDYAEAISAMTEAFEVLGNGLKDEVSQALFLRILGLDSAAGSDNNTLARSLFHGLFQSSQQAGREEMDWYWFEMLHYRKTGDFVKALIRNAEASNDEAQMAYAYGYATHYAADLVGHPFVNTISGSPYRINVQRHVVIENYMDQWKWSGSGAGNIRNTLFGAFGFGDMPNLPDGIAALIASTIEEVYRDVVHPLRYITDENTLRLAESVGVNSARDGFLSAKDIQTSYTFQKLMLKFLGGQEEQLRPEEPFPGADAYLADLMSGGDLNIPSPPGLPSTPLPNSVEDFFAAIVAWFQAAAEFIEWLVDATVELGRAIGEALLNFLSDPAGELLKLLQALAYAVQLFLYDIYRMIHQVLALSGLAYPEPEDAALTSPIAEALVTTRKVDYKQFPIVRQPGQPHLDTRSYVPFLNHANHPDFLNGQHEHPTTIASFYTLEGAETPDGFIDSVPLDLKLLTAYARAETPEDTRTLQQENAKSFGNAVDISLFMLANRSTNKLEDVAFCNWNLDGDRGYGYKSWDGIPFTAIPGEIDGAIDGNEDLAEVRQQGFSVWTSVAETGTGTGRRSRYTPEVYVGNKETRHTLLSALNISEQFVPSMFTDPERMTGTRIQRWSAMVPERLAILTASPFTNMFFCNGMTTTPSSGIRSTMALQKTLNGAFEGIADTAFHLKHLHNYTSLEWGDHYKIADLVQSIGVDYLSSLMNTDAVLSGGTPRSVVNPTQVAAMALLHHGMEQDIPLVLCGHSQGCMITANAVLVFSTLGQGHRDYLKNKVKLFHLEPELIISTRLLLRDLVRGYLVYIMNNSDPMGSDLLMEAASGPFPLIPGQPGGLVREGAGMAALNALMSDPDPLSIEFYTNLAAVASGTGNDLTELMGYISRVNMTAHFMPVQLPIIAEDIRRDRFRTDPGTLSNGRVQLSTANTLNATSIRVREFLTT